MEVFKHAYLASSAKDQAQANAQSAISATDLNWTSRGPLAKS